MYLAAVYGKKRKIPKRGSSSSETEEVMAASANNGDDSMYNELKNCMDCLKRVVSEGFVKLHTDLDKLRFEFKTEIDAVKLSIKDIKKSLTYTQGEVEDLKEHFEMEAKEHSKEVDALNKKIADLEERLKQEVENNIALEQYTRRENLRFNNIEEKEHGDCTAVIYIVLEKDLGVDTTKIRFHAVNRVGKKIQGRHRPIIARFVCREDRDKVWSVRGKLKESITHADAYITEDYARAIQEERKVLIESMVKAREEHGLSDAKVKGRVLFIKNERYDSKSIPEYLKQP